MLARIAWPVMVNVATRNPVAVTLIDGREVDHQSEEWRAECEARHVLRLPDKSARWTYLNGVERKRGKASRDALEAQVWAVWEAGRTTG